jgi:hypothetical protein
MTTTLERPAAPAARRRRRRTWWLIPFAALWLAILAYMLSAYLPPDIRTSRIPVHGNTLHYWLLVGHIGTAAVATVTGFPQFWPWLRRRHPRVHRWTGRVYLFGGVFPSMVLAVPVAVLSPYGFGNMSALFALDALWILTAVAGYRAARQRRYAQHRAWMIRNFALALASLASRLWTPLAVVVVFAQADSASYRNDVLAMTHDIAGASAWLALVSTVLIAEAWIQRRYGIVRAGRPRAPEPT